MWAGDTRKRILANVQHYGGDVVTVAITAPGKDRLPDRAHMFRWNRSAPRRWRDLHRAARQVVIRQTGRAPTLLCWTWEYQKRGALHKHLILGVKTAQELHAAHLYVRALDELRHRYAYGFVDRGRCRAGQGRTLQVIPAETGARYLAKYLSPLDEGGKPTLSETVTRDDVPPLVAYVSRALTSETGVTMRWLRWCRQAYVLGIDPMTGELLVLHEEISGPSILETAHSGPPDL